LCKVSLWMEALEPGKPLSFLDHRILCGNSLLGTTPDLLAKGVPDEAFKALEGDDKKVVAELRRRNQKERSGQRTLFPESALGKDTATLARAEEALDGLSDDSITTVEEKAARYRHLAESPTYRRAKLAADAWCATFVAPKTNDDPSISQDLVTRLREDPECVPLAACDQVVRVADEYRFFHWHLAFPGVFEQGGFDLMVGNPPWERLELQDQEFFATRAPDIAAATNAAKRKKMIFELAVAEPTLYGEYCRARRRAQAEVLFMKESGRYPLGAVGKINTYAVFADLSRQSINAEGFAALIIPNGLVTGYTYREFLKSLVVSKSLLCFYGFENEDKIFPSVHNETKFGILVIGGHGVKVENPWFTAHLRNAVDLTDPRRRYTLNASQISAINPNTLNLPALRWAADADVLAAIHKAAPVLVRNGVDGGSDSPWGVQFRQLFNMAADSGVFQEHHAIIGRIVRREGAAALSDDGQWLYPLLEGKMLWHFDHRYGTYEGQTEKQANKKVLPHVTDAAHDDPEFRARSRYWVSTEETDRALGTGAEREWFFAWRDVGPSERTFVGCIVPKTGAGHKAPIMWTALGAKDEAALAGILSSLVCDYDARQRSNQMAFYVVEQLAVLPPTNLSDLTPWLGSSARDWLADRVLELSYTNIELEPFARAVDCKSPPFRWVPERRAVLQAEIDAVVLHLYGLTRSQAEWLVDSFTVLRKYEERDHGEFRTKRLVLEIYDAMAAASEADEVYRTRLDPPPADPRMAHLAPGATREPGEAYRWSDLLHSDLAGEEAVVLLEEPVDGAERLRVRFLCPDDPLPALGRVVIVRHPDLKRGSERCALACGRLGWQEQRNAETGEQVVLVTLRGAGPPATLRLPALGWPAFRPLAVATD
jgi:hypothetical protein